jgi:serpin B
MKAKQILSIIFTLIIIVAAIFVAIQYIPESDTIVEESIGDKDDESTSLGNLTFKEAVNAFAFDIFKDLNKQNEGNLFISPYSIFTALAMCYEGAKGETADQMADVLAIEQDNASFHNYMKNLYELLNRENNEYNISTANALWLREDYRLLESYLNIIKTFYGGDATELDFSDAQKAADIINEWVENNTNGLIKDLILPDYINIFTTLILTNAIYFKGMWKYQFDIENTTDRDFKKQSDETIKIPTMQLINTENSFNYTETEDVQVLELPYSGDDISMLILLPKDNEISNLIENIDDSKLSTWKDSMEEINLDIYLPKFKVESKYQLKDHLNNLGMVIPFTSAADFSGMNGIKELYISKVIHKAYIDVNEEGTEAAAATAVIMERFSIGGSEEIIFDCNHPFVYLIQHKQTGTILFMGSILDPTI